MLVAKTLLTVREGDLLSLTVTPGDGGGHLASGEDETREIWMTVTKISTSTGGRRQLEGESNGLRVQLIDQGRGLQGARLGVAGPVLARGTTSPKDRWIESLRGWRRRHVAPRRPRARRPVLRDARRRRRVARHARASVGARSPPVDHRGVLADATRGDRRPGGVGDANRRRALGASPGQARRRAVPAARGVAFSGPTAHIHLAMGARDAQAVRRRPRIKFEMSESDDVEAHAGISVVLYRAAEPGAGAPSDARARSVDPALAARTVAALGAQADCPAVTPYERVLVGMALGYSERDVAYHHKNEGGAFSAMYFARARRTLGVAESVAVADAGMPRVAKKPNPRRRRPRKRPRRRRRFRRRPRRTRRGRSAGRRWASRNADSE